MFTESLFFDVTNTCTGSSLNFPLGRAWVTEIWSVFVIYVFVKNTCNYRICIYAYIFIALLCNWCFDFFIVATINVKVV